MLCGRHKEKVARIAVFDSVAPISYARTFQEVQKLELLPRGYSVANQVSSGYIL